MSIFDVHEAREITSSVLAEELQEVIEKIKAAASCGKWSIRVPELKQDQITYLEHLGFEVSRNTSRIQEVDRWGISWN